MKAKIYHLVIVCFTALGLVSCEEMLDVKPDKALEPDQVYRDRFDADAAVIGVYGKFLSLADRYMILNELRADLMDVTVNADLHLREINSHNVSIDNPYADPRSFYEVILHCNDVLKNLGIMLADDKLLQVEYDERYSDIMTLRSWLYLQVALHWGEVPYITEPLANVEDLNNLSSLPKLTLQNMIDKLIADMTSLPTKEQYAVNSTLNIPSIDGWNTRTFFINKRFFLGDLYLWKGEYNTAATYYKDLMMVTVPGVDYYDSYRVKYADVANNNDIAIGYIRDKEQDFYSLIDNNTQGWKSMFIRGQDALFNSEWIWVLPFESRFRQETPFVDLFSNTDGRYVVKPSQTAIDLWNSQVQRNGFPWDQRGRFTYSMEGGQPVIKKHIYNYSPTLPLEKNGKWFLARAALLHLRFAEAANRDNQMKMASAFLNNGILTTWDPNPGGGVNRDVTNIQNTLNYPDPYKFDARNGQNPFFRGTWHRHAGVRGRAYVNFVDVSAPSPADSVNVIEHALITEAALELAYEGNRWADLVRVAMRRNDPSFLANKVADKLAAAGHPDAEAVRAKLMDQSNWFLPFPAE